MRIVLGVTGSIAAYKSAELVRLLRKSGHEVRVVMTEKAQEFIGALTLQSLSGERVRTDFWSADDELAMGHIELARWAERILIAPATAQCLAELAQGAARELLGAVVLASQAPVWVAPAMNQQMWAATATQDNVARLKQRGVVFLGPGHGEQACGDVGEGRMLEPDAILVALGQGGPATGLCALVSAGATYEPIDPVRFLGNHSSGKMGVALATAFRDAGARVILVAGQVTAELPAGVDIVSVATALEMQAAVAEAANAADIFVSAAAVADYRPATVAPQKIKKSDEELTLRLIRNPDILSEVASRVSQRPLCVGFAAESNDVEQNALVKLTQKQLDMIIANDISRPDQGFGVDSNAVTVLWPGGRCAFPTQSKRALAVQLIPLILERYYAKKASG